MEDKRNQNTNYRAKPGTHKINSKTLPQNKRNKQNTRGKVKYQIQQLK